VDETHTVFLGISHLITLDGFNDTLGLLLERTKQFGGYFFVVDEIVGLFEEVINHRCG
jgi:hypothetical protein